MNKTIDKINHSTFINKVKSVLSSKYYPFVTAAITLLCYYLGWDIVLIYYIGIAGILILLLLDDVTPIIHILLFMDVMISLENSPSPAMGNSDYYFRTEILVQIFLVISLFIAAAIFRLINTVRKRRFKVTPIFFSMCALAAALFFNGAFTENYNPKNLLYALILAACFLGIYSAIKDSLKIDKSSYEKIAFAFMALSVLLLTELIVKYATTEDLIEDGIVNRWRLVFGWGVYNTYGVLVVMCIPAVMYLAGKKKFGFFYTLYSVFLILAAFFCCSRQAMLGAVLVYPICAVALLIKGKNRIANLCIYAAAAVAIIVLIAVYHSEVSNFFEDICANIIVDGELNGSGRTRLWRQAFENFRMNPLFGTGFYTEFSYAGMSGLGFIPLMCHNTVMEILSACGLFGFAAYLAHRILTIKSFIKNITAERLFIGAVILSFLFVCLFDNHIFNIFPTIIYSGLIAVLEQGENKDDVKVDA